MPRELDVLVLVVAVEQYPAAGAARVILLARQEGVAEPVGDLLESDHVAPAGPGLVGRNLRRVEVGVAVRVPGPVAGAVPVGGQDVVRPAADGVITPADRPGVRHALEGAGLPLGPIGPRLAPGRAVVEGEVGPGLMGMILGRKFRVVASRYFGRSPGSIITADGQPVVAYRQAG